MQLKMSNKFNIALVKKMVKEEEEFISKMFSTIPPPLHVSDDEGEEDDEEPQTKGGKLFHKNGDTKRAQTSEELYQKFNELKGQKKLSYKQKKIRKNLKNRLKKKTKREERKIQKKLIKTEQDAAGSTSSIKQENENAPKVARVKPVFNSEGHMVFSKFDFSDIGNNKRKSQKVEKDPKKILENLKEKKQKIKELVESGENEKAQEIQEKEAWKTALAKASGEKVKDDPELLKRTIQRDEQTKKRSAKKWESRIAGVEKSKQEKQQKRQENIMKRKKEKKTTKLKKASKKGRIIPGF